jgi:hypothetical protein
LVLALTSAKERTLTAEMRGAATRADRAATRLANMIAMVVMCGWYARCCQSEAHQQPKQIEDAWLC